MLKEIWITRHGMREDWHNPTPIYPTGLIYDSELSAQGLQQALELGVFLQDKAIQRIYTSPFYRVLQTILPLAKTTQVPIHIDYAMA
jgi:transcription factor C subunit 7